jgi:hypothetical protein
MSAFLGGSAWARVGAWVWWRGGFRERIAPAPADSVSLTIRGAEMHRLDPPWPTELRAALRRHEPAYVEVLPPLAALSELQLVAEAAVAGRPPASAADIGSLRDDVRTSLARLGTATRGCLGNLDAQLARELAALHDLIKDPAAVAAVAVTARAATARLGTPEAVTAAWRDVVDAWRRPRPGMDRDVRLTSLIEILDASGQLVEAVFDVLGDLMINRSFGLAMTAQALGLRYETDEHGFEVALTIEDRLARAERYLTHEWDWEARIVWFVHARAEIHPPYLPLGPLEFYDSSLWPRLFDDDPIPELGGHAVPPELADLPAFVSPEEDTGWDPFEDLPASGFVLTRVTADSTWPDRSPQFLKRLVSFAIALAYPASAWVMLPGDVAFQDGRPVSGLGEPPTEPDGAPPPAPFDQTGAGLASLPLRVIEAFAAGDERARELEGSARWVAAVSQLPEAPQRVALGLRGLEAALPPDPAAKGWRWRTSTKRFLFTPWRDGSMMAETRSVLALAIREVGGHAEHPWRTELDAIPDGDPAVLQLAQRALPELLLHLDAAPIVKDQCADLQHRLGPARKAWVQELEDAFDALLARAVRLRNSVLHGGPVATSSLESVDGFVERLGGLLNDFRMLAIDQRTNPLDLLEHIRVDDALGSPDGGL